MSDYISLDLLHQILKWMPVKTLLQWRSVSRSWKQLIDSTPFILDHLSFQRSLIIVQLLQNRSLEYFLMDPRTLSLYDTCRVPDGNIYDDLCFFSSVNGVICLYDYSDVLLLWNPSIHRLLRIPLLEYHDSKGDINYCGFWIDPSNNDFKIVIFCFEQGSASLFSSTSQEWKVAIETDVDFQRLGILDEHPQILIQGVAYWGAVCAFESFNDEYLDVVIIFFDFWQEKFGMIELPGIRVESPSKFNVCKWKGLLSFVYSQGDPPYSCDFWVMQNESWSKMSSFNLMDNIVRVFSALEDWGWVLGLTNEALVLFDPRDGCIPLSLDPKELGEFVFAIDFVESLVFPDRKCIPSG